jgi:hypothetical protein
VQHRKIVLLWTIASLTSKAKVAPFVGQPVIASVREQQDAIDRDAQLGPKMVDITRRTRALDLAVPTFSGADTGEPVFQTRPTGIRLNVS